MPPKPSVRGEFIETETGNKISRRASILGPKHIILAGKCVIQNDVVIHGDLVRPATSASSHNRTASTATSDSKSADATSTSSAPQNQTSIHLGRHVYLSPGVVLHPPSRLQTPTATSTNPTPQPITTYLPLTIASHVFIGASSVIRALEIKSHVWIGANVTVGNMCIIKENVKVLDGSVLPQGSVWASGNVVGGRPARVVGVVGEGWGWGK
ncbi:Dynactin subunit 5 [Cyphellophora attinorum]|uniref:Dynactin subunit 5 n=1 Tax=Cyphellophora attinorum TaxID=1664694 RepID=A0A0N1H8T6_9EURO|nr:Dynactin subunit 5 [Phialophora attinorum]KPI43606.1 Dynactin subunit 5 [Phialophora attinorum]